MSKTERAPETHSPLPGLPADMNLEGMMRENYAAADPRDIFSKLDDFTLVERAREIGIYPFFQALDNNDGTEAVIHGQRVLMFGSNNYLGLTRHPHVIESARAAILKYGSSMTGSRLLNGTTKLHEQLEGRVAQFLHTESAIVFTTGYQANLGIIAALVDNNAVAVVDKSDHASIYDGCQLSDGEMVRFRHN
ncbi:MAG: aminotransferase class I/II-fold pyridoxal phosphate-dependent enzyme, partial [Chloroflexota bacterium]